MKRLPKRPAYPRQPVHDAGWERVTTPAPRTPPVTRYIPTSHGRSSARLEPAFWEALRDIQERTGRSLYDLVRQVEIEGGGGCMSSSLRVLCLRFYREGEAP